MMGWAEPSRIRTATAPRARAICAIFHAEAKDGAHEECEGLLADLALGVRADEPGCLSYVVTRAMGSAGRFVVHARFADWRAFEEHADTRHVSRLMPSIAALLASPLGMELYLEI